MSERIFFMRELKLKNPGSPGVILGSDNAYQYLKFLQENSKFDKPKNKKEQHVKGTKFSYSQLRLYFPFLYNFGIIESDYAMDQHYQVRFTKHGDLIFHNMKMIATLEELKSDDAGVKQSLELLKQISEELHYSSLRFFLQLSSKMEKKASYYSTIEVALEYLNKYKEWSREGFLYIAHIIHEEERVDTFEKTDQDEFVILKKLDTDSTSQDQADWVSLGDNNITAYSYIAQILIHSGIIDQTSDKKSDEVVQVANQEKLTELCSIILGNL